MCKLISHMKWTLKSLYAAWLDLIQVLNPNEFYYWHFLPQNSAADMATTEEMVNGTNGYAEINELKEKWFLAWHKRVQLQA